MHVSGDPCQEIEPIDHSNTTAIKKNYECYRLFESISMKKLFEVTVLEVRDENY